MHHLDADACDCLIIELISRVIVGSSAVKGEILDRASVQSSIAMAPINALISPEKPSVAAIAANAIAMSYDLFGHIIVELNWSWINTREQSRTLSFAKYDEASRLVEAVLKRRASAKHRLDVSYSDI